MIQPAQAAITKAATRTQKRTSNHRMMVPSLEQVLLAITKPAIIMTDIGAGNKRRTLARKRQHHLVKNDAGKERIRLEREATEIISHHDRRLHRATREIQICTPSTTPKVSKPTA